MHEINQGARSAPLADCPYCEGEGTDPDTVLGICRYCYGRGRVARFLAERTLERWARQNGAGDDEHDEIEDEVSPAYPKTRRPSPRGPAHRRPWARPA